MARYPSGLVATALALASLLSDAVSAQPSTFVAEACRAAIPRAAGEWIRLAAEAIGSFAAGRVELASACAGTFADVAGDASLPPATRWAALAAFARLSTLDSDVPAIAQVATLFTELEAADPTASLAVLHARIEWGVLLELAGRAEEARDTLLRALQQLPDLVEHTPMRLRARQYLAWAHAETGHPQRGLAEMTAVFQGWRTNLGEAHPETNLARLHVGSMLYTAGRYADADAHYAGAGSWFASQLGPGHPYTLRARRGAALVAVAQGRLEHAAEAVAAALADAVAAGGGDDPEVLALRVLHGQVHLESGDAAAARRVLADVLPRLAARYGEDARRVTEARDGLATVCIWQGDAACALRESERALLAAARLGAPYDLSRLSAEGKYASALILVGRTEEALKRLEQAVKAGLPVHGAGNRWVGALLFDMALVHLREGRSREALDPLLTLAGGHAEGGQEWSFPRLLTEHLLAAALNDSGEPARALERLQPALAAAALQKTPETLMQALLVERGKAALHLGRPDDALVDADLALSAQATLAGQGGLMWLHRFDARLLRGEALRGLTREAESRAERRRFIEEVEAVRSQLDDSAAVRQAYLRQWVPAYKRLAIDEARAGRVTEAFRLAELARSRTLTETLGARTADAGGPRRPEDRVALAALLARLAALDEAWQSAGDDRRIAIESDRRSVAQALARARADIAARDPPYAALLKPPVSDPALAAGTLGVGELYVSYTLLGDTILALALDEQGRVTAHVTRIEGSLRDAIESWRALLQASPASIRSLPVWVDGGRVVWGASRPSLAARRAESPDDVGAVLSRWLLKPLAPRLAARQRLAIAVDPALALIPFDALPWRGAPLVTRQEVSYVQSFGVLRLLATRRQWQSPASVGAALVVADPAYDSLFTAPQADGLVNLPRPSAAFVGSWPRLPGTRREAAEVGRLFARSTVLLGSAATETAVQAFFQATPAPRLDLIHFATHARISARLPWSSALVLAAPGPGDATDGYLTAAEMLRIGMSARLVVLSACETATGDPLEGEGVIGFPYALMSSGTRATLLTLWPTDDAGSARLMPRVVSGVRAGWRPSLALARAKREWIAQRGKEGWRDWAGVVLYGR